MAEYVTRHFVWDRRGVAFPLSPFSCRFVVAKEVIFYAMLLTKAKKLGFYTGECSKPWNRPLLSSAGVPLNHGGGYMARFRPKAKSEESSEKGSEVEQKGQRSAIEGAASLLTMISWSEATMSLHARPVAPFISFFFLYILCHHQEIADHVRGSFIWRFRRVVRPSSPLLEDFQELCPHFLLPEAERATLDFKLLEMIQATFYAMLMNDVVELGIVDDFMADGLASTLVRLGWMSFEA
ncbi:hypothetical protein Cgig2_027380 [Carnegiea gigantea]|uniref:Uncharacterized protein n=1 Tax=Carnegiea gigantea TaxID=171969 RepID=A0A9Q1QCJ7_9CARY|nr:hypothetical protein Cgig2_027380 [Carnegiea gigantea]